MKRAAFLDRDGVINKKAPAEGYITRWEDLQILPGVAEAIALLNRAGWLVIVITNQQCIAKGLLTPDGLLTIHKSLQSELASRGAHLDAIYYCPHHRDDACPCRKPAPGMVLGAAKDHDIDLAHSWMVGDTESDIEAGRSAGCHTILITAAAHPPEMLADLSADSLLAAAKKILSKT